MNVRFTTWLSEGELRRVKEEADRHGTSANFIIRTAVRQFLGLPTVVTPPPQADPTEPTASPR